jgi:hypothetical protein
LTLDLGDALAVMQRWVTLSPTARRAMLDHRVSAVRMMSLDCIADGLLIEFQAHRLLDDMPGLGSLIYRPGRFTMLTGVSAVLHDLADDGALRLGTLAAAQQYLLIFCAAVQGDAGCFFPLTGTVPLVEVADHPELADTRAALAAPMAGAGDPDRWTATLNVAYGTDLFRSSFEILPTGMIQMTDDVPLAGISAAFGQRWDGPIRISQPGGSAGSTGQHQPGEGGSA